MEWEEALRATEVRPCPSGTIGTVNEKWLHAALKRWLDDDESHHEVVLPDGHIADLFDGTAVTEIQTAGFSGFRPKLERLLEQYPVTVVHPVIRKKWVSWIDPATGEVSKPRRSPRQGTYADAGRELIYLLPLLGHPRLTVRLILLDVEEQRLADGWGRNGKRGSHRAQRIPLALAGDVTLSRPADYAVLLPEDLPEPFTAEQFGRATHIKGRTRTGTLKVLYQTGCLSRRTDVRPYLYSRAAT